MKEQVLFVGLDLAATSMALAMAEAGLEAERVGFEADNELVRAALHAGAVGHVAKNLGKAARDASLIVLRLSASDLPDVLRHLGRHLKNEAVVLDASPTRVYADGCASEALPQPCHYVGILPIVGVTALTAPVSGELKPQADLFKGGLLAIAASRHTSHTAIQAAAKLAEVLQAAPYFVDPLESDGVLAGAEALPTLLGMAMMSSLSRAPNWRDIQRLSGRALVEGTLLATRGDPEVVASSLSAFGSALVGKLDSLMEELRHMRELLVQGDEKTLGKRLTETQEARKAWLASRRKEIMTTEMTPTSDEPIPDMLERLFGSSLSRRRKPR